MMKHKIFKIILLIILLGVVIAIGIIGTVVYKRHRDSGYLPASLTSLPFVAPNNPNNSPVVNGPESYSLDVPFTPQAPTANWDELHNEACEEASAIMAAAYFSGDKRKQIPATEVEKQITTLTDWQQQHFSYHLNTTAAETAETIREVYGLKAEVVKNFSEDDVKQALRDNKVVIIPVNGRKIGNPYYQHPGPIYHMLVIRGYSKNNLVTNDSGTKHGENYQYKFSTINNATADWDHAVNTIDENQSVMIVVSK